jgi:hypothetical protein
LRTHRFSLLALVVAAGLVLRAGGALQAAGEEGREGRHARWDRILKANVNPSGWVNYARLAREDRRELKAYLDELASADVSSLGEKEAMAFWINAYNAVCVQLVLDRGVPAEVPRAVLFGYNIFKDPKHKVAGKARSLEDIEHGILRVEFKDPRVHAAIVCAASSCPRLRAEAYEGDRLDAQLDEECRSWIAVETDRKGERKNRLDRAAKTLYVSKIFEWFAEDFGGEAGVLRFVGKYASESDREFLEKSRVRLRYLEYRWELNKAE